MDHAVVVEGNILLDDEDDESSVSSEESEQDVGSSSANYVSSSRRTYDDDEEEIEVFTEGNSSANTVSKQAPASKPSPVKGKHAVRTRISAFFNELLLHLRE